MTRILRNLVLFGAAVAILVLGFNAISGPSTDSQIEALESELNALRDEMNAADMQIQGLIQELTMATMGTEPANPDELNRSPHFPMAPKPAPMGEGAQPAPQGEPGMQGNEDGSQDGAGDASRN